MKPSPEFVERYIEDKKQPVPKKYYKTISDLETLGYTYTYAYGDRIILGKKVGEYPYRIFTVEIYHNDVTFGYSVHMYRSLDAEGKINDNMETLDKRIQSHTSSYINAMKARG